MSAFERMFDPRGIAVVGASADPSRTGGQTVHALATYGYRGEVFPVNPKYDAIAGYRCYQSVDRIDRPCDVAVIALPAAQVPATIAQCGAHGIPYAVVLGGGFRESSSFTSRVCAMGGHSWQPRGAHSPRANRSSHGKRETPDRAHVLQPHTLQISPGVTMCFAPHSGNAASSKYTMSMKQRTSRCACSPAAYPRDVMSQ